MNKINPLANAQFPASSNTWDFINEMILLVAKIASLGGQNYILSGCVDAGNAVGSGIIVMGGDLIVFQGGAKTQYIIIEETNSDVIAGGVTYNSIYTTRIARFGGGVGQVEWATFLPVTSLDFKANIADVYTKIETDQRISDLVNGAPGALDTLHELADALGSDPNFATTVLTQIGLKAPLGHVHSFNDLTDKPIHRIIRSATYYLGDIIATNAKFTIPFGVNLGTANYNVIANLRIDPAYVGTGWGYSANVILTIGLKHELYFEVHLRELEGYLQHLHLDYVIINNG